MNNLTFLSCINETKHTNNALTKSEVMSYKRIFGFVWLVLFSVTHSQYVYSHHCNHKDTSYITLGFSQSGSEHQPCNHRSDKGCCESDSHSCNDSCCSLDNLSLETVIINGEKRISKQDENFDHDLLFLFALTSKFPPYIHYNIGYLVHLPNIYDYTPPLEAISTVRLIC